MNDNFNVEIISPEKIIFSDNTSMTTFPSYEGDMSILKDHIPLIAFLRPGMIKIKKANQSVEEFFVQDGAVEYFNNSLVILSSSAVQKKSLSKEFLENLNKEVTAQLLKKDITDHDRYILNHKLDAINQINF
jgi:ATP synthase F1 epsilon subunit